MEWTSHLFSIKGKHQVCTLVCILILMYFEVHYLEVVFRYYLGLNWSTFIFIIASIYVCYTLDVSIVQEWKALSYQGPFTFLQHPLRAILNYYILKYWTHILLTSLMRLFELLVFGEASDVRLQWCFSQLVFLSGSILLVNSCQYTISLHSLFALQAHK